MSIDTARQEALELLKKLISTPRTSRNESAAADIIRQDIIAHGYNVERTDNNILCKSHYYNPGKPAFLLNSHIDTVKPVASWTRDPFNPQIENGRLYGLGSNDAGASLVSLLQTFYLIDRNPNSLNLIFLATAQEEVGGAEGMRKMASMLPPLEVALVGEPTGMQPAIAEKGLLVLDMGIHGKSGHAARDEGINAIYRAEDVIRFIREYRFDKISPLLGPVRMTVTVINAGTQHNVVPDLCTLTVDIRGNEYYTNEEIFGTLRRELPEWCDIKARSMDLNSSGIDSSHPLIRRAVSLGLKPFGSPTLSDQALLECPSFKMGPGMSSRSHSADEFIMIDELSEAIPTYLSLLDPV